MPQKLAHSQSDGGTSSTEALSSQVTLACVKLMKTNQPSLKKKGLHERQRGGMGELGGG